MIGWVGNAAIVLTGCPFLAYVCLCQIIAKDTIEDQILEIQAKKNDLIQQAFAGNRTKETARQKKEARFNEIAALFGVDHHQGVGTSGRASLVQQTL